MCHEIAVYHLYLFFIAVVDVLEKEVALMKEWNACGICWQGTADCVFRPCGHLCCSQCVKNMGTCHVCRCSILGLVHVVYPAKKRKKKSLFVINKGLKKILNLIPSQE